MCQKLKATFQRVVGHSGGELFRGVDLIYLLRGLQVPYPQCAVLWDGGKLTSAGVYCYRIDPVNI